MENDKRGNWRKIENLETTCGIQHLFCVRNLCFWSFGNLGNSRWGQDEMPQLVCGQAAKFHPCHGSQEQLWFTYCLLLLLLIVGPGPGVKASYPGGGPPRRKNKNRSFWRWFWVEILGLCRCFVYLISDDPKIKKFHKDHWYRFVPFISEFGAISICHWWVFSPSSLTSPVQKIWANRLRRRTSVVIAGRRKAVVHLTLWLKRNFMFETSETQCKKSCTVCTHHTNTMFRSEKTWWDLNGNASMRLHVMTPCVWAPTGETKVPNFSDSFLLGHGHGPTSLSPVFGWHHHHEGRARPHSTGFGWVFSPFLLGSAPSPNLVRDVSRRPVPCSTSPCLAWFWRFVSSCGSPGGGFKAKHHRPVVICCYMLLLLLLLLYVVICCYCYCYCHFIVIIFWGILVTPSRLNWRLHSECSHLGDDQVEKFSATDVRLRFPKSEKMKSKSSENKTTAIYGQTHCWKKHLTFLRYHIPTGLTLKTWVTQVLALLLMLQFVSGSLPVASSAVRVDWRNSERCYHTESCRRLHRTLVFLYRFLFNRSFKKTARRLPESRA